MARIRVARLLSTCFQRGGDSGKRPIGERGCNRPPIPQGRKSLGFLYGLPAISMALVLVDSLAPINNSIWRTNA
jgi:hypothetical protein